MELLTDKEIACLEERLNNEHDESKKIEIAEKYDCYKFVLEEIEKILPALKKYTLKKVYQI